MTHKDTDKRTFLTSVSSSYTDAILYSFIVFSQYFSADLLVSLNHFSRETIELISLQFGHHLA